MRRYDTGEIMQLYIPCNHCHFNCTMKYNRYQNLLTNNVNTIFFLFQKAFNDVKAQEYGLVGTKCYCQMILISNSKLIESR